MNDLKFAFRQMLKNPGFAAVAALTLALVTSCQAQSHANDGPFIGAKAGVETNVGGVRLCWCPPGKFMMGSPRGELERRPGEDQVEVTLTNINRNGCPLSS